MSERQPAARLPWPICDTLRSEASSCDEERMWTKILARRGGRMLDVKLPSDVATVLQEVDDGPDRARRWAEIRARLHARRSQRRPSRPVLTLAVCFAGLLALVLHVSLVRDARQPPLKLAARASALLLDDGTALGNIDATSGARTLRFADASEIRLAQGARIEPVLSSQARFEVRLATGRAEFSVTPGGPRRWVVQAGSARIEVLGTIFEVTRGAEEVTVSVVHGKVLVTDGEQSQVVVAGEHVRVRAAAESTRTNDSSGSPAGQDPGWAALTRGAPTAAPPFATETTGPVRARAANWRALVEAGAYPRAYASLGEKGLRSEIARTTDIEELLALADVARLSGHPRAAVPALERALRTHRAGPHAALAAFTLGRIYLDQLGLAQKAARAFERAIAMHPPQALLEDCYARLAEARTRL